MIVFSSQIFVGDISRRSDLISSLLGQVIINLLELFVAKETGFSGCFLGKRKATSCLFMMSESHTHEGNIQMSSRDNLSPLIGNGMG